MIPRAWPLADAKVVVARAAKAGFQPPGAAEHDRLRLAFAFIGSALVKSKRPRERLSWLKSAAESLLGALSREHVWLPEHEVRAALHGMGFRVVGDRVWCRALPETSEALAALVTPALREALAARLSLARKDRAR